MTISELRAPRYIAALSPNRPLAVSCPTRTPTPSFQTRHLWRGAHHRQTQINEEARRRMDKHRRICLSKMRNRISHPSRRPHTIHNHEPDHHPWYKLGWGWTRFKSGFPNERHSAEDFWDAERRRTHQRIEQIKRQIEADPYAALFGRRLEHSPWQTVDKMENTFSSLYRSVFGIDQSQKGKTKDMDTTARAAESSSRAKADTSPVKAERGSMPSASQDINRGSVSASQSIDRADLEFDPISGRMSPRKQSNDLNGDNSNFSVNGQDTAKTNKLPSKRVGYLSPVERERQASGKPVEIESSDTFSGIAKGVEEQPTRRLNEDGAEEVTDSNDPSTPSTHLGTTSNSTHRESADCSEKSSPVTNTNGRLEPRNDIPTSEKRYNNTDTQARTPREEPGNIADDAESHSAKVRSAPSGSISQADETSANSVVSALNATQPSESPIAEEKLDDLNGSRENNIRPLSSPSAQQNNPPKQAASDPNRQFESHVETESGLDAKSIRDRYKAYRFSEATEEAAAKPVTSRAAGRPQPSTPQGTPSPPPVHDESVNFTILPGNVTPDSSANEIIRYITYNPAESHIRQVDLKVPHLAAQKARHIIDILPGLKHPDVLIPYIPRMQAEGYELHAGSAHMLAFKKRIADPAGSSPAQSVGSVHSGVRNEPLFSDPIREPVPPFEKAGTDAGSAAHPVSPDEPAKSETKSSPKRKSGVFRRMLVGGVATAGTCYAIGVVSEYFRTGGQDGQGIDAFTAFESERRQREREEKLSRA